MAVVDEVKRPQAIFYGFDRDDPAVTAMGELVSAFVCNPEAGSLRYSEWDIVVTKEEPGEMAPTAFVLNFGQNSNPMVAVKNGSRRLEYAQDQIGKTLHVADDLSLGLKNLVGQQLVPWLQQQTMIPRLRQMRIGSGLTVTGSGGVPSRSVLLAHRVFVHDADQRAIAGDYQRVDFGSSRIWIIPFTPSNPERWLAAAMDEWRLLAPETFVNLPGWRTRPTWLTQPETAAATNLEAAKSQRVTALLQLDADVIACELAAEAAKRSADLGLRRLLTEQGYELSSAVHDALTRLGFSVEDRDSALPTGIAKAEDLRVTDPGEPEWTNITEVKGYAKGAKQADLQKIAEYAGLFLQETGQFPTSRWYIANQWMNEDPDQRQLMLSGGEDSIAVFASFGGVLIDTRELFKTVKAVEAGLLSDSDARFELRTSAGRFACPA